MLTPTLKYQIWSLGLIASFCIESAIACGDNQVTVIKSNAKLYPLNTCLAPNSQCHKLATGEQITLQAKGGNPYILTYSRLEEIKCNLKQLIETLIKLASSGRSLSDYCQAPEQINPVLDSDFCFESSNGLKLCRTDTSRTETLSIEDSEVNKPKVDKPYRDNWLAGGNKEIPWPLDKLPIRDDVAYQITLSGKSNEITFHEIPSLLPNSSKGILMATKNCLRQANEIMFKPPEEH